MARSDCNNQATVLENGHISLSILSLHQVILKKICLSSNKTNIITLYVVSITPKTQTYEIFNPRNCSFMLPHDGLLPGYNRPLERNHVQRFYKTIPRL